MGPRSFALVTQPLVFRLQRLRDESGRFLWPRVRGMMKAGELAAIVSGQLKVIYAAFSHNNLLLRYVCVCATPC